MLPYAFNQLRQAAISYQLNNGHANPGGPQGSLGMDPRPLGGPPPGYPGNPLFNPYAALDPLLGYRAFGHAPRFIHEEPKPQQSYIGLIAMAILSNPEKKMVLSDIYQYILDNYAYFRTRGPGWRNSIRHNLSLNDCFIKAGRSANGKGHYWAIHPANVEDFKKGDFRRRRAQRKVRKHMGLAVPDEEEDSDESPCNSPAPGQTIGNGLLVPPTGLSMTLGRAPLVAPETKLVDIKPLDNYLVSPQDGPKKEMSPLCQSSPNTSSEECGGNSRISPASLPPKKRTFDMESLLAPEAKKVKLNPKSPPHGPHGQFSPFEEKPMPTFPFPGLCLPGPNHSSPLFGNLAAQVAKFNGLPANPAAWPFSLGPLNPQVSWAQNFGLPTSFGDRTISPVASGDSGAPQRSPSPNVAAQWQETFAKIMARSYQGRQQAAVQKLEDANQVLAAVSVSQTA